MKNTKLNQSLEKKDDDLFELRPYTHAELHKAYNVCWVTFQRWTKKFESVIGKKTGHFYLIPQVLTIFRIFGVPKKFRITLKDIEEMYRNQNVEIA